MCFSVRNPALSPFAGKKRRGENRGQGDGRVGATTTQVLCRSAFPPVLMRTPLADSSCFITVKKKKNTPLNAKRLRHALVQMQSCKNVLGSLKVWAASDSNTNLVNIPTDYVGRTRCHLLLWTWNLHMQHGSHSLVYLLLQKVSQSQVLACRLLTNV